MNKLIEGTLAFQNHVFKRYKSLFRRLEAGQNPEALFITCSDSRIDPCLITQTDPGDLFVLRNAGNVVPIGGRVSSEAATIEYAVKQLKVKHIILCGHSSCGAIASIVNPDQDNLPYASDWLSQHAEAVGEFSRSQTCSRDNPELHRAAAILNVKVQLDNLRRYRFIRDKIAAGELELHGWFYDLSTGKIMLVSTAGFTKGDTSSYGEHREAGIA